MPIFTIPDSGGASERRTREYNDCNLPPGEGGGRFGSNDDPRCGGSGGGSQRKNYLSQGEAEYAARVERQQRANDEYAMYDTDFGRRQRAAVAAQQAEQRVQAPPQQVAQIPLVADVLRRVTSDDGRDSALRSEYLQAVRRGGKRSLAEFDPPAATRVAEELLSRFPEPVGPPPVPLPPEMRRTDPYYTPPAPKPAPRRFAF